MDFGRSQRSRTTFDHFRLSWINFYPFTRNNGIKKLNLSQPNFTFILLSKKLVILENLQKFPQVTDMIIITPRVYQDVIYEDNNKQVKVISENSIRKVHESRRDIFLDKITSLGIQSGDIL